MAKEIRYCIQVAYLDEIYGQGIKETSFYITNEKVNYWDNYEEVKKVFDKIVSINEQLIQLNKRNTFFELNLIKRTNHTNKILEHHKYD